MMRKVGQLYERKIAKSLHHIAIVGSGPSGFYTAKYLLEKDPKLKIDLFEKLPVY